MASLKHFLVSWTIDIYAASPRDAAKAAATYMTRGFTPHDDVYDVAECATGHSTSVDLAKPEPVTNRKLQA
jgi:hypothetical protein